MSNPEIQRARKGIKVDGERAYVVQEVYDDFATDTLSEYEDIGGTYTHDATNGWIESTDQSGPQELILESLGFKTFVAHVDIYIPSTATNDDRAGITFYANGSVGTNEERYYRATLDFNGQLVAFKKNTGNGNNAMENTADTLNEDTWYRLTVYRRDDGLTKIYVDDPTMSSEPIVEGRDTALSTGRIGVFTTEAKARFNNFLVEPRRMRKVDNIPKLF